MNNLWKHMCNKMLSHNVSLCLQTGTFTEVKMKAIDWWLSAGRLHLGCGTSKIFSRPSKWKTCRSPPKAILGSAEMSEYITTIVIVFLHWLYFVLCECYCCLLQYKKIYGITKAIFCNVSKTETKFLLVTWTWFKIVRVPSISFTEIGLVGFEQTCSQRDK